MEGIVFKTTPLDIAKSISNSLAKKVIAAKVRTDISLAKSDISFTLTLVKPYLQ
jgi:hypothetical protein